MRAAGLFWMLAVVSLAEAAWVVQNDGPAAVILVHPSLKEWAKGIEANLPFPGFSGPMRVEIGASPQKLVNCHHVLQLGPLRRTLPQVAPAAMMVEVPYTVLFLGSGQEKPQELVRGLATFPWRKNTKFSDLGPEFGKVCIGSNKISGEVSGALGSYLTGEKPKLAKAGTPFAVVPVKVVARDDGLVAEVPFHNQSPVRLRIRVGNLQSFPGGPTLTFKTRDKFGDWVEKTPTIDLEPGGKHTLTVTNLMGVKTFSSAYCSIVIDVTAKPK